MLAEARTLAAAMRPATPLAARRLLWALSPFGVWAHRTVGTFTADTINARNVEVWIATANAHRPRGWRNAARSVLRQVGRTVNPLGWPEQPDEVGRPPACAPYDAIDEALFREAAGLPGVDDPATTLWVAAAACGAGMRGPEIGAAELGDLTEVEADRLVVQVRGRDARLVPIRACWTDTRPPSRSTRPPAGRTMRPVHRPARPQRGTTGSQPHPHRRHRPLPAASTGDLADRTPRSRNTPTGAPRGSRAALSGNPGRPARRGPHHQPRTGGHRSVASVSRRTAIRASREPVTDKGAVGLWANWAETAPRPAFRARVVLRSYGAGTDAVTGRSCLWIRTER